MPGSPISLRPLRGRPVLIDGEQMRDVLVLLVDGLASEKNPIPIGANLRVTDVGDL